MLSSQSATRPPEQRAKRPALAACSCVQASAAVPGALDVGPLQPGNAASAAHNNPTPMISFLTDSVDRMSVCLKQARCPARCLESPAPAVLENTHGVALIDKYPYGKAPFALLVIAVVSVGIRVATARRHEERPDLVIATYTDSHYEEYRRAIPRFEREHGVKVQLQLVNWASLQARLQS